MALPAFDRTKHHVGLGTSAEALKGLILSGGYRESGQRLPRDAAYGETESYVQPSSLSRWTMDDFLGGAYFDHWSATDPARFSSSLNLSPAGRGRTLRTVPPMVLWYNETTADFRGLFAYGDYLFVRFPGSFVRFTVSSASRSAYTRVTSIGPGLASYNWSQIGAPVLWEALADYLGTPPSGKLYRMDISAWTPTVKTTYNGPAGLATADVCEGVSVSGPVAVASWNRKLYVGDLSATDATQPTWTLVDRLPGAWVASELYNGYTYILCVDESYRTYLCQTDGSVLYVLVEFPFNFIGRSLAVYGGRVYVGGDGWDYSGSGSGYVELYEVTGSSVRVVQTWAPYQLMPGADLPVGLKSMVVYDGRLWLGVSGQGLIAYDVGDDALHGVSALPYSDPDDFTVEKLVVARNQLFAWCEHTTSAYTGLYRLAQAGDTVPAFEGELVTGDFVPEPGLLKRWSEVHLYTRYSDLSAYAPEVEYSTDGGSTWTAASVTHAVDGYTRKSVADLSGASVSPGMRLRFTFPRDDDVTGFTELLAFTLTFSFLDSGKRSWSMAILGARRVEDVSGDTYIQDVDTLRTTLWSHFNSGDALYFSDIDGDVHKVSLIQVEQSLPVIGPVLDENNDAREAFFQITLVEA